MTADSDSSLPHGERRQHARVHDAVGLQIHKLADRQTAGGTGAAPAATAEGSRRRQPNKYDIPGYADVRRDHPAVADYIAGLEERIRQLLLDGDPGRETPNRKVSLSKDGLVFADDALLQSGELLGITLTLFPQLDHIACDCQIEPLSGERDLATGGRHTYRVRFLRMSDHDRQLLENHIDRLLARLPSQNGSDE